MKEVFETKCRQVDLDQPGIMNHCDGLSVRTSHQRLMKLSLPYPTFNGDSLSMGLTLWNSFVNQRSEFKNRWMCNYSLVSGETVDQDGSAVERMIPHLWVAMKNKSVNSARNRIKRKGGKDDDLKKIQDTTLEEYKEGDYSSSWMLTFQNFKPDHLIKRTCGGTAASAVELDDIPSFAEICKNRKDQRKVD
jgi:hypothetical protein